MILLVDDDDDFRMALAGALRDDGYEVVECANPADLPSEDLLNRVELVISDYQMPGKSGLAFADDYHSTRPDTPIILVTAHWSQHLETQVAMRDRVSLYRKPLDYAVLEDRLPRAKA